MPEENESGYDSPGGILADLTPGEAAVVDSLLARLGRMWWLVLALGLVSIAVGVVVFLHPFEAVRVAAVIFGIWLLVSGLFQLVQAFGPGLDTVTRVLAAVAGVIGIILGIICFESVGERLELLVLFIGIWWIIRGLIQVLAAATTPSLDGWLLFQGIVGILAGCVVLVWNIESLPVLAVLAGIWLVVIGIIETIAAFRVRALADRAPTGVSA